MMTTTAVAVSYPLDDEQCWATVCRRDPAAETAFFYSVASTGIYCRPTCPSRRPRRDNVAFHVSRQAAEAAGFRPCKRCRPDQPSRAQREAALVTESCRWLESAEEPPTLNELAARAGLSPYHFHRLFKRVVGVTPYRYARAQRTRRLTEELRGSGTVTEALYQAGYNASSRCYEEAGRMLGMTPGRYRAGGEGLEIFHAVRPCSLGQVLVAVTERGICNVQFGDSAPALREALRWQFPKAQLTEARERFQDWVDGVLQAIEAPTRASALPLDIRGSAFQLQVWEALRRIPTGSTASYAEIARCIGRCTATRAVARACASNPLAVLIPCHRVVRSDGATGGYRWGEARKQALLAREREQDPE